MCFGEEEEEKIQNHNNNNNQMETILPTHHVNELYGIRTDRVSGINST